jgi:hypothetical protein
MRIIDLLTAILGGAALPALGVLVLRVWGYRVELKIKPVRRRRRGPVEPDEHTAFL